MSFKIAMKLLSIFGIDAQSCLNFDHFRFKCKENKQNLTKFRFQAQKLLKSSDLSLESYLRVAAIFENLSLGGQKWDIFYGRNPHDHTVWINMLD